MANGRHVNWANSINPFFYIVVVLGIVFFLYQVLGGILALVSGGGDLNGNVNIMRLVLTFGQFMFILAPTIFFARLQTSELKKTFRLNLPAFRFVILTILGIILIQPILQGYMYFQEYVLNHVPVLQNTLKQLKDIFDMLENAALKIVTAYSTLEYIVVVVVICVTPAICEEMLFRGFVLSNMRKIAGVPAAIFMSAFLFAIYHFEPFNIIPLAMLGAFLGFVVYYSNSIYIGMLAHFLNNFLASFYLFKYGKQDFDTPHITSSEMLNSGIAGIVSLMLFLGVLYLFYKFRYNSGEEDIINE